MIRFILSFIRRRPVPRADLPKVITRVYGANVNVYGEEQ